MSAAAADEPVHAIEEPSDADAQPFAADGGPVGVVLSHGFTGTPASLRAWAEHLAAAGYTVRLPLLPGHGHTWRETNESRWPQWYDTIAAAYRDVRARCETVFGCGLSMGATLVTRLAEEHPEDIAGLVLVNPAYGTRRLDAKFAPLLKWVVKSRPAIGGDIRKPDVEEPAADRTPVVAFASLRQLWKVTVADLDKVRAPILMYRSRVDHVVDDLSQELLKKGAVNTTVDEVMLEDSFHVATLDNDAPQIFAGSVRFIETHTGARSAPGPEG